MKWKSIALSAVALVALTAIGLRVARKARETVAEKQPLETPEQKLGYAMGVSIAKTFERQIVDIDADAVARGLRDRLSGSKLLMSDDDLRTTMASFKGETNAKRTTAANQNRQRGETFLAENAKSEGVVTLPSGLQYKVLKAGSGAKATDKDVVQCHYRGTHVNGGEFDNSYARGKPATFQVARAMAGWKEALKLMPLGSKWTLFLPSQLAFGERGMRPRKLGPQIVAANETVVFELELLAINPPRPRGATTASGDSQLPTRED
jgi:FKBP-type peptidyl-prolyl cis-trans isomerase